MASMHPGPVIRLLRTASGLSLRKLARMLDVSATYMHQVETERGAPPSPERIDQLAVALSVPPGHLHTAGGTTGQALQAYVEETPEVRDFVAAFAASGADPIVLRSAAEQLRRTGELRLSAGGDGVGPMGALTGLASPDRVLVAVKASAKGDVLDALAARVAVEVEELSAADLAEVLADGEAGAPTGIGRSVALPHLWIEGLPIPLLYIAQIPGGVDWGGTGPAVRLVVLSLAPQESEDHIVRLARLSAVLSDPALVDALADSPSAEALVQAFEAADARHGT